MIPLYVCSLIVGILAVNNYEHQQYEVNYFVNDDDDNQGYFDPKEYFFRSMRTYEGSESKDDYLDLPRPGGLNFYAIDNNNNEENDKEDVKSSEVRNRRDLVENQNITKENSTDLPLEDALEKQLGKPLELGNLDTENATFVPEMNTPKIIKLPHGLINDNPSVVDNLQINDFIRFKRGLEAAQKENDSRKYERETEVNSKLRSGKMLLAPDDIVYSGNREPRGTMKNQWLKQPYSIQSKTESSYEDVSSSATESARAPRVHFVTQRRSESSSAPVYRQYNYDTGRSLKDLHRDTLLNPPRNNDRDFYVRQSRHYDPYPQPPSYYDQRRDPYYRFDEFHRYEQKFDPIDRDEGYNKHRRIIYYATLPEVVRSPPNVDLRDRYVHRDRYDDRYVTSRPLSVSSDPYRYRKGYQTPKARFEENDRTKVPYPLKVSTDVNVREIKKNPERRIYSEADQRYTYKTPTYPENTYDRL